MRRWGTEVLECRVRQVGREAPVGRRSGFVSRLRARSCAWAAGVSCIPGAVGDREGTRCPGCDKLLIGRSGFRVTSYELVDGKCPGCGTAIPGVWGGEAAVGRSGIPRPVWLA